MSEAGQTFLEHKDLKLSPENPDAPPPEAKLHLDPETPLKRKDSRRDAITHLHKTAIKQNNRLSVTTGGVIHFDDQQPSNEPDPQTVLPTEICLDQ